MDNVTYNIKNISPVFVTKKEEEQELERISKFIIQGITDLDGHSL